MLFPLAPSIKNWHWMLLNLVYLCIGQIFPYINTNLKSILVNQSSYLAAFCPDTLNVDAFEKKVKYCFGICTKTKGYCTGTSIEKFQTIQTIFVLWWIFTNIRAISHFFHKFCCSWKTCLFSMAFDWNFSALVYPPLSTVHLFLSFKNDFYPFFLVLVMPGFLI